MNALNRVFPILVLVFAVSCGQNSTKKTETDVAGDTLSTTTTADTGSTSSVPVTGVTVPETIQTSFKTKYPDVRDVTWSRYAPVSSFDWDWSGWPVMDTTDYMAKWNWDNSDYWAWYDSDKNEWVGTVSSITNFSSLPEPVNKVISSQYAGYTIVSVDKEFDKNRTAYEIDLAKGDDKMMILVDENGKVMKKKTLTDGQRTKEKNVQ